MIILPGGTEQTWNDAETAIDWLRISNKLAGESLTMTLRGQMTLADDWHLLSMVALERYCMANEDEQVEQYRRMAA